MGLTRTPERRLLQVKWRRLDGNFNRRFGIRPKWRVDLSIMLTKYPTQSRHDMPVRVTPM